MLVATPEGQHFNRHLPTHPRSHQGIHLLKRVKVVQVDPVDPLCHCERPVLSQLTLWAQAGLQPMQRHPCNATVDVLRHTD